MSISRRGFLQAGMLAAVAAGTPLRALAQADDEAAQGKGAPLEPIPYASRLDPVFYLKQSSFAPYLNTQFRARGANKQAATLTLVAVNDLRAGKTKQNEDAFSLLFTGPRTNALTQDIYQLKHAALGEFSLLLVRVQMRDEGRAYYEAIINRMQP